MRQTFEEKCKVWEEAGYDPAKVEWKSVLLGWNSCNEPHTYPDVEYRLKKETIIVNGIEVPAPFKGVPKRNQRYYFEAAGKPEGYNFYEYTGTGDEIDSRILRRVPVYLNREDMVEYLKAKGWV